MNITKRIDRGLMVGGTVLSIVLGGCGHINKLADYPVQGGRYFFKTSAASDAGTIHVTITNTDTSQGIVAMSALGEHITAEQLQTKINRVPVATLATAAGRGIHEFLVDYLHAVEGPTQDERASFAVETKVKDYELRSSGSGAEVRVSIATRIIDRSSATVIWDDHETQTVKLQGKAMPVISGFAGTFNSIASAARLLALTDDQFLTILERASEDAGRAVAETFRDDIDQVKK